MPVMGMMCAGCSANVERKLKAIDGIKTVAVSLPGRTVMVEYDEKKVTPADMKQVIDLCTVLPTWTHLLPCPP